jgi:hypothetical protein
VRYDLLRHGHSLDDMGTTRLRWGDAFAILSEQSSSESAVRRALFPKEYHQDQRHVEILGRLEVIAVILAQNQAFLRNPEAPLNMLPTRWEDLVGVDEPAADVEPAPGEVSLYTFEDIDKMMGW